MHRCMSLLFAAVIITGFGGACYKPVEGPAVIVPEQSGSESGFSDTGLNGGLERLRRPVELDESRFVFGTVRHISLEGGFWGIVTDSGRSFNPVNLKKQYRKNGLEIEFVYEKLEDVVSIQMWGEPVEILEIRKARR